MEGWIPSIQGCPVPLLPPCPALPGCHPSGPAIQFSLAWPGLASPRLAMPGAGRWRRLPGSASPVGGLGQAGRGLGLGLGRLGPRRPRPRPAFLLLGSGMAEAAQLRVQEAVEGMVQDLERETIRKMQGTMFRCSAACCENSKASMQQVHQCIERCHTPLAQAQALVTQELERFQDRLSRCSMHCTDKAKDSFDSGGKEHLVKQQLETCVTKCVDDHMSLIPSMGKKMKESLAGITQ